MRNFAFLLLLLSFSAFGQKRLNSTSFQSHVRPVLNAILNDFYQMVVHFPSYPKELVGTIKMADGLNQDKDALLSECPRELNEKCLPSIDSLRHKLTALQARTLALTSNIRFAQSAHINSQAGLRLVQDFHLALETTKGNLDNISFLLQAKIQDKKSTYALVKELDGLNTMLSLAVVEFIPQLYKEDFRHFYFNFIRPIEQHVSKTQNYEFLNQNVNQLNIAFNLLNMNLTKRNKKTPEGMGTYLSLIHNRWNSLMRYYR